jgi:GNAT superfamily N-acetyltransferase
MAIEYARARQTDVEPITQLYTGVGGGFVTPDLVTDAIEGLPAFVARDFGNLVGFTYCRPAAPDVVELANIFVDPGFRRMGIGSELLSRTQQALANTGRFSMVVAYNSELYQKEDKNPADGFYRRMGFRVVDSTGHPRLWTRHLTVPDV